MNNDHAQSLKDLRLTLKRTAAPEKKEVNSLEKWRVLFYRLGLIGEYPNKQLGYGALSSRHPQQGILINGAQTGHLASLQDHHYTRVTEADLKKNAMTAEGLIPPPREALSHYQLYQYTQLARVIFQIHSKAIWKMLKREEKHEYRRHELKCIEEVEEKIRKDLKAKSASTILCSEGDWGVMIIASSVDEAGRTILNHYKNLRYHQ